MLKNTFRNALWKLLGIKHQLFLKNQKGVYLDDCTYAEIGAHTYNNGAKVWRWNDNSELVIGKYCSIGNDVHFILDSGYHTLLNVTTYPVIQNLYTKGESFTLKGENFNRDTFSQQYVPAKKSIVIQNEVWIGAGVTILPGVTIGNGAIILAGAVVSKSVEAYSIVSGVPAKHLQFRFPEAFHKDLQTIAWWNWETEKVKHSLNDFEMNIEDFIFKHKQH